MLVAKKYLLGALLALSATTVLADEKLDLTRAGELVTRRCSLCHGLQGESASPVFPRLAGQHAEYIAKQLTEFKSGKRKSETMKPQAEDLTPAVQLPGA
jgi:cytochrome c553